MPEDERAAGVFVPVPWGRNIWLCSFERERFPSSPSKSDLFVYLALLGAVYHPPVSLLRCQDKKSEIKMEKGETVGFFADAVRSEP